MFPATRIRLPATPQPVIRPAFGLVPPSGFSDDVTNVVGSAITRLSSKSPPGSGADSYQYTPASSSVESPLRSGMRLGPFRLLKRIGQGAQGDVWKAKRLEPVAEIRALKILNPAAARRHNRLAQFHREAERGARLAGPSLLQVMDYGQVQGYEFMAMKLVS